MTPDAPEPPSPTGRRSRRNRWMCGLVCLVVVQILFFWWFYWEPGRDEADEEKIELIRKDAYFIAALFRDSEPILRHLLMRLPQLVSVMDPKRTFVSFLDSGSTDSSSELLGVMRGKLDRLGVGHRLLSMEQGRKPDENRIAFLAQARNQALEPLMEWKKQFGNDTRTRILYLNDVVWEVTDIVDLLLTNGGEYDMACGLDFYWRFYDLWVTRDVDGDTFGSWYPYARRTDDQAAVRALQPFTVYSCWNGATVLPADAFVGDNAVAFRTAVGDECPESECFVVCTDLRIRGLDRIFVNPRVLVAYNVVYYDFHHLIMPWINPIIDRFNGLESTGRFDKGMSVRRGPKDTPCGLE